MKESTHVKPSTPKERPRLQLPFLSGVSWCLLSYTIIMSPHHRFWCQLCQENGSFMSPECLVSL